MWNFESKKFNGNTLTSVEIKVEPPELPLNNDDTLCDTDFVSESNLIGTAEIKEEIEINYVTRDGQSKTSLLDSEIKIEIEETDLKKEWINEINEKSDIEDFENIFVQSNQEHVIKKEENQELIDDPLQGVAEGKTDEERGHFEFIGINHSKSFQENSNNVDVEVDSDSHVLIHSERENLMEETPLNTQMLIHTSEKSYKCEICGKLFGRKGVLKRHITIHTAEKPHKCGICGQLFSQASSLNTHKFIHTGEKPYECETCGKLFSQKKNLKRHNLVHTGEKSHKCDTCGKLFSLFSNLKTHKLIHNGEQPYKCDICGKLFSHMKSFNTHKLLHTGEKPYKCDICGKLFTYRSSLNSHKLIHTGEKAHKCDICGKLFNLAGNLNKHKLIHKDIRT